MTYQLQAPLLTIRDVQRMTTLSRASIYRFMAAGTFPKSVAIGPNRRAWKRSEVEAWAEAPSNWDTDAFDQQDAFYARQ